jgi:hypothetical protein
MFAALSNVVIFKPTNLHLLHAVAGLAVGMSAACKRTFSASTQTVSLSPAPMDVLLKQTLVVANAPTKNALRAFAAMKLVPLLQATFAVRDPAFLPWHLIVVPTRMSSVFPVKLLMVAWLMNAVVNIAQPILACVVLSILLSVMIRQAVFVLVLLVQLENAAKISARPLHAMLTTTWGILIKLALLALLALSLIAAPQPRAPTTLIFAALPALQVGFLGQALTQRTSSAWESATLKFAAFL